KGRSLKRGWALLRGSDSGSVLSAVLGSVFAMSLIALTTVRLKGRSSKQGYVSLRPSVFRSVFASTPGSVLAIGLIALTTVNSALFAQSVSEETLQAASVSDDGAQWLSHGRDY